MSIVFSLKAIVQPDNTELQSQDCSVLFLECKDF